MDKSKRLISVLKATYVDPRAKKTADFYQHETEIKEAIADGWKIINIWKLLKERDEFSGSYDTFRRYVNRYVKRSVQDTKSQSISHKNENRLTAQLAKKALCINQECKKNQKTLALFLGKQDEIKEALDAGYQLKTIWKTLVELGVFEYSYNCFTWYVRKYLTGKNAIQEKNVPLPSVSLNSKKPEIVSSSTQTGKAANGFEHFNYHPTAIDKDSLI